MVGGQTNNGNGTTIFLTDKQAEFELAQGTIILKPDEDAAPEPEAVDEPKLDLAGMTIPVLLALAKDRGFEVNEKARKPDLIAEIEAKIAEADAAAVAAKADADAAAATAANAQA